jgi:hypothetical protein
MEVVTTPALCSKLYSNLDRNTGYLLLFFMTFLIPYREVLAGIEIYIFLPFRKLLNQPGTNMWFGVISL